jgi:Fe-S-cluster containining protein
MLAYLNLEAELFVKKYCRWVDQGGDPILSLVEKSNFDCIFWDQGCTIYQARPDQCRSYPFLAGTSQQSGRLGLGKALLSRYRDW